MKSGAGNAVALVPNPDYVARLVAERCAAVLADSGLSKAVYDSLERRALDKSLPLSERLEAIECERALADSAEAPDARGHAEALADSLVAAAVRSGAAWLDTADMDAHFRFDAVPLGGTCSRPANSSTVGGTYGCATSPCTTAGRPPPT